MPATSARRPGPLPLGLGSRLGSPAVLPSCAAPARPAPSPGRPAQLGSSCSLRAALRSATPPREWSKKGKSSYSPSCLGPGPPGAGVAVPRPPAPESPCPRVRFRLPPLPAAAAIRVSTVYRSGDLRMGIGEAVGIGDAAGRLCRAIKRGASQRERGPIPKPMYFEEAARSPGNCPSWRALESAPATNRTVPQ